jgi:hypothetical protein
MNEEKEPIFTREEAVSVFRFLRGEFMETMDEAIESFEDEGRVKIDPSDLTEGVVDLALLAGQAAASVNPLAGAAIAAVGPVLKNVIVGAVQKAEDKARSPEVLRRKILRAVSNAQRADARADRLLSTPKREAFEKVLVKISRRRAHNQRERAEDLRAMLVRAAAE